MFRPRRALLTASALSTVLAVASVVCWLAIPAEYQALFTLPQLLTLAFFVLVMIAIMMSIGLSYLRVDDTGLTYRNGLPTRHLSWAEVRGFRFTEHDPWAYVLLADDLQRPLLGIQRTDRDRAEADFAEVVRTWRARAGS
ncbi:MAG: PH domain-containing protein [Propionicimonas sp.]